MAGLTCQYLINYVNTSGKGGFDGKLRLEAVYMCGQPIDLIGGRASSGPDGNNIIDIEYCCNRVAVTEPHTELVWHATKRRWSPLTLWV